MRRDPGTLVIRIMVIGAVSAALLGVVAFSWFVVISWNVLRTGLGLATLLLLLVVAGVASATWASVLVSKLRRPARPLTRIRRVGIGAISLLAAVTGLIAVPATRSRLESNKCRHRAAPDALSQADCRIWLESRREWWTLGLSHKNPPKTRAN